MISLVSTDKFDSNLQVCYEILLYLSSRLARLQPGSVLEFISGDTEAGEKIAAWCDVRGYTLLESGVSADGRTRFLIQK
jgi:TusA-related sulfurtransferase